MDLDVGLHPSTSSLSVPSSKARSHPRTTSSRSAMVPLAPGYEVGLVVCGRWGWLKEEGIEQKLGFDLTENAWACVFFLVLYLSCMRADGAPGTHETLLWNDFLIAGLRRSDGPSPAFPLTAEFTRKRRKMYNPLPTFGWARRPCSEATRKHPFISPLNVLSSACYFSSSRFIRLPASRICFISGLPVFFLRESSLWAVGFVDQPGRRLYNTSPPARLRLLAVYALAIRVPISSSTSSVHNDLRVQGARTADVVCYHSRGIYTPSHRAILQVGQGLRGNAERFPSKRKTAMVYDLRAPQSATGLDAARNLRTIAIARDELARSQANGSDSGSPTKDDDGARSPHKLLMAADADIQAMAMLRVGED
ncbi:hypothetical protein DFH09DRAFT_1340088 [Mycena vulgaris]|nr:hypothetical protein DFH09DRAFT_1340088 [Mycena vulgaris]